MLVHNVENRSKICEGELARATMSMFEPVFERRVRMLFSEPGPHDDTLGERARALWREGLYQTFEATGIPPAKRCLLYTSPSPRD